MAHRMDTYIYWSFIPLLIVFAIPMIISSICCMIGFFCQVKCIDRLIYAIVGKVVRIKPKKLDLEKKHNTFYGYKVTRCGMYYFFFFITYIFSASVALLWSKFILRESFECRSGDKDQDCFYINNKKPFYCPYEEAASDANVNIVCYKFVFAYGKGFIAAGGLFASCITAFSAISFIIMLISTCVASVLQDKKITFCCLHWISGISIAIQVVGVVLVIGGYIAIVKVVLNPSKLESSEIVNLTAVVITVCYAICFPWWSFQNEQTDYIEHLPVESRPCTCSWESVRNYWFDTINEY